MMYGVFITYSWGDIEPVIKCESKEEAWSKAKELAMNEAETASIENDCTIELSFDDGKITLHYMHDDEFCYYEVMGFD
jgi:hypothetical protein